VDEHTSAGAALTLAKVGLKNVYALKGGYNAWVAAGYKVEQGSASK
jgi:rhodanese-related sulfurtransferase